MFSIIPRSFFFVVPLQIGAELIAAFAVVNKVSAVYAMGALFTGHRLTVLQWIMNSLSFCVFPIAVWGWLSIFHRRPLRVLLYAYFYVIDTLVSLGFTIYFIVYWFAVAGKFANNPGQNGPSQSASMSKGLASISSTVSAATASGNLSSASNTIKRVVHSAHGAYGTHPTNSVAHAVHTTAEALRSAAPSIKSASYSAYKYYKRDDDLAYGSGAAAALDKSMTTGQETAMTIVATTLFLLLRFYFMFVVVGYARQICRRTNLRSHNGQPQGSWAARVQFLLIAPVEKFWTGQSRIGRRSRSRSFGPAETQRLEPTN